MIHGKSTESPWKSPPDDQLYAKFPTESVALAWFEQVRWPGLPALRQPETTEAKNRHDALSL